jgi:hypothetical protein
MFAGRSTGIIKVMTNAELDRWHLGGRWYTTTLASDVQTRDGMGLELDDVAPAPGRGTVLEAFHDEQFIAEARRRLPPLVS